MNQSITFVISADGSITYEMDGFQGDACIAAAEQLIAQLAALGVNLEVSEITRKQGDERVLLSTTRPVNA